jgi:uncharacterized membrane-anchored protein YitT (DUF2179 family)
MIIGSILMTMERTVTVIGMLVMMMMMMMMMVVLTAMMNVLTEEYNDKEIDDSDGENNDCARIDDGCEFTKKIISDEENKECVG